MLCWKKVVMCSLFPAVPAQIEAMVGQKHKARFFGALVAVGAGEWTGCLKIFHSIYIPFVLMICLYFPHSSDVSDGSSDRNEERPSGVQVWPPASDYDGGHDSHVVSSMLMIVMNQNQILELHVLCCIKMRENLYALYCVSLI